MKKAFQGLKRGFTLIELIITIVIIGILAAVALVGYQAVVDSAEERVAATTLQSVDREYRALDAFNAGTGVNGVALDDMSDVPNVEFNDTNGNGVLETGETAVYEKDGVVSTLVFNSATTPGDISTSTAGDGSSESADPYAGWDSYTMDDGTEVRFTSERTGLYDVTLRGAFVGVTLDAPLSEFANGSICVTVSNEPGGCAWVYDADGGLVLETDGTWEFAASIDPNSYPFNNSNYDVSQDLVWFAEALMWSGGYEFNNSEWSQGKPVHDVEDWNG